jgi:hypothetical protein
MLFVGGTCEFISRPFHNSMLVCPRGEGGGAGIRWLKLIYFSLLHHEDLDLKVRNLLDYFPATYIHSGMGLAARHFIQELRGADNNFGL